MSKQALIEAIEATGATKAEAEKAIKLFTDAVTSELAAGKKVQLVGFGTFEPRVQAAREARNPRTGETVHVVEKIKPAFTAGEKLKAAVNA